MTKNKKKPVNSKTKMKRIFSGVICFILILTMLLPIFLTGCSSIAVSSGESEAMSINHNDIAVIDNVSKDDGFSYHGYTIDNTPLDWFFSSEYVEDVESILVGEFVTSFVYLDTTYVVFGSDKDCAAIVLYDGEVDGDYYIQIADDFTYDSSVLFGDTITSMSIDYTDAGLYLYSSTDITKVS